MWWLPRLRRQALLLFYVSFTCFIAAFVGYGARMPDLVSSPSGAVIYGFVLNCVLWYFACLLRGLTLFTHDSLFTYLAPLSGRRLAWHTIVTRWPVHLGAFLLLPATLVAGGWLAQMELPPNVPVWSPLAIVSALLLYFAILFAPVTEALEGPRSPLALFFVGKYLGWLKRQYSIALIVLVIGALWYTNGGAFEWVLASIDKLLSFGAVGTAILALLSPMSVVLVQGQTSASPALLVAVWALVLLAEVRILLKTFTPSQQTLESRDFERWLEHRVEWTEAEASQADTEDAKVAEWTKNLRTESTDEIETNAAAEDLGYDASQSTENQILRQLHNLPKSVRLPFVRSPHIVYRQIMRIYPVGLALLWLGWLATRGWWPNAFWLGNAAFFAGMLRAFVSGGWWKNSLRISLAIPLQIGRLFARTVRRDLIYNILVDLAASTLLVLAHDFSVTAIAVFFLGMQALGCCSHLNTWIDATMRSGKRAAALVVLGTQGVIYFPVVFVFFRSGGFGHHELLDDSRVWYGMALIPTIFVVCNAALLFALHRRADTSLLRTT